MKLYLLSVFIFVVILRGIDKLSGEVILANVFCLPSEYGPTLKGKNLLIGAYEFF